MMMIYLKNVFLSLDEEGVSSFFYDERKKNGHIEGNFPDFYEELDRLLEDYGNAGEERRKIATAYLPLTVSVTQLIRKLLLQEYM